MATPCPGSEGCQCPYCFGLTEYMHALTGADYGLPVTYRPFKPAPAPEPVVVQLRPRETAPQPWVPRPARKMAA
jgi:hypothetical protein